MIKEWVSRFNWWPRPELSGRGNNLIPPPLSYQQEPPTMTTSREALIARLHYYACEDAEQGNVLAEIERLRHDIERHIAMASELATENERLRAELEMAYAEIREQVAGSKVVFDRDLVNRAKDAKPYNNHRIAWELERTAIGDGYYGNALRVAKDIPGLTPEDRSLLDRYATGSNAGTDHVALQALAMRIDAALAAKGE